jgi:hypothetical protein
MYGKVGNAFTHDFLHAFAQNVMGLDIAPCHTNFTFATQSSAFITASTSSTLCA